MITLILTCSSMTEARTIASALLNQKLIACARMHEVTSLFRYNNAIDSNDEIQVIMESREDLFERINAVVGQHHSYQQYVLTSYPVSLRNEGVDAWLEQELQAKPEK